MQSATEDGWQISGGDVFNFNAFRDSHSAYNGGYGVYFQNGSSNPPEGNTWDRVNVEYNGTSPSYFTGLGLPCAGFYANGTAGGNNILASYFEGNCDGSGTPAHIVFAGTYNQG